MTTYNGAAIQVVLEAGVFQSNWLASAILAPDSSSSSANDSEGPLRKGSLVVLVAKDSLGAPLPGLTPTWLVYKDAVSGSNLSAPSITPLGLGHYKFTLSGTNPVGILDLGNTARPQYLTFTTLSSVWVVAAFSSTTGQPLSGLTPIWTSLKRASDGTNYPQPAISQVGGGLYKTDFPTERLTGVIDLGTSASPRYVEYDTNRPLIIVPIASEF